MLADLRYGCRSLLRSPGFTAANVLTLGLGAGATIAVLALLDAVLLRPLPLSDPDRTVTLHTRFEGELSRGFVYPEFERIRGASGELFEVVAGSGSSGMRVTTPAGARTVCRHARDGAVLRRGVGIRPTLGRGYAASEHRSRCGSCSNPDGCVLAYATRGRPGRDRHSRADRRPRRDRGGASCREGLSRAGPESSGRPLHAPSRGAPGPAAGRTTLPRLSSRSTGWGTRRRNGSPSSRS